MKRRLGTQSPQAKLLVGLMLALTGAEILAQNFTLAGGSVTGGGGTSTGSVYSVTGTIGQADAGRATGGSFAVEGGLWALVSLLQTPGAPQLSFVKSNGSSVTFTWPDTGAGFVLQQNNNLTLTNGWTAVTQGPTTNNGQIQVLIPIAPGQNFFRLKVP
ncbi:MAG: hypothetical protein WCO56_24280 [Verrucomicrobiota bacterium]